MNLLKTHTLEIVGHVETLKVFRIVKYVSIRFYVRACFVSNYFYSNLLQNVQNIGEIWSVGFKRAAEINARPACTKQMLASSPLTFTFASLKT